MASSIQRVGTVALLLGIAAAACPNVWAQQATGSFERTLDVEGPVQLEVVTGSGDVSVSRGPDGRVEITGRIRIGRTFGRSADEAEEMARRLEASPPIEVAGDRVRVGPIDDPAYRNNVSISYAIVVPQASAVRSRTGSGDQALSGVAGGVDAETGSGAIALQDVGGPVRATAGSGSIRAQGVAGALEARTGSGSISVVQTAAGNVEASAGSGDIELSGVDGALHARTGSGSLHAEGRPAKDWDLQTGSGSIRLGLPADAAFDLDAHTGSGSIRTNHPVTQEGTIGRNRLTGTVRGGGPLVHLSTGSGSIRIE
jgi:DUF4097 and DUF4098 domain-containing protein YvlB